MDLDIIGLKSSRAGYKGAISKFINEAKERPALLPLVLKKTEERLTLIKDLDSKIIKKLLEVATDDNTSTSARDYIEESEMYVFEIEATLLELRSKETETLTDTASAQHTTTQPSPATIGPLDATSTPFSQFGPMDPAGSKPGSGPLNPPGFTPGEQSEVSTQNPFLSTDSGVPFTTVPPPIASSTDVRLSRIDLPIFDGDATKWQEFWDAFYPTVHMNNRIPVAEKFTRLRNLLSGRAARVIAGFATTANNYQHAIESLFDRFGHIHTIAQSHMQQLVDLPPPSSDYDSLELFYDNAETHIRALTALGHAQDGPSGTLLAPLILNKLPRDVRQAITRGNGSTEWTLPTLRAQLKQELDARRPPPYSPYASVCISNSHGMSAGNTPQPRQNGENVKRRPCPFCSRDHGAANCHVITDITRRKQIIAEKHLCYNCLSSGHSSRDCRSIGRCRKCNKKHHTAVCQPSTTAANFAEIADPSEPSMSPLQTDPQVRETAELLAPVLNSSTCLHVPCDPHGILLQTAIAEVTINGHTMTARILFDTGAQRSMSSLPFIQQAVSEFDRRECISIAGVGDNQRVTRTLPKQLIEIKCLDGSRQSIDTLVLNTITAPIRIHSRDVSSIEYLKSLPLAHPAGAYNYFDVDILIGADHYWDFVESTAPIQGDGPTAQRSKLGYLLSGPISRRAVIQPPEQTHQLITTLISNNKDDYSSLTRQLERFWTMESLGINQEPEEPTENEYRQIYQASHIRFVDGQYEARLPWKDDFPELPTNLIPVTRMTKAMFNRMPRTTIALYDSVIQDQARRNFIEMVADLDLHTANRVHYIPHHPILKDSATSPVRIVYNCSYRPSQKLPSLNDCLRSTPPVLNDIPTLLIACRNRRHMVISDIEKAFLQISLHPDDRDVTRFMWPNNPLDPSPQWATWRFKSILFGATSSPFILDATLRKHLANNPTETGNRILECLYVDNVVAGFDSTSELLTFFNEARSLMHSGGFNLRGWKSTDEALNDHARLHNAFDPTQKPKVLGLVWDPIEDTLSFPPHEPTITEQVSKRDVASAVAKIYDPLGILGPVTIKAKIFLQKLHTHITDVINPLPWDAPINQSLLTEWEQIQYDLQSAANIKLPRMILKPAPDDENELHVFVDASTRAYGTAAYLVSGAECTLVMARNRVAPLKALSLPKLELMALLTGARLQRKLNDTLRPTSTHIWTDSQIVLAWLSTNKTLDVFTRNRVKEIRSLTATGGCSFHYCPTDSNPSDLQTRGIDAQKLIDSTLWKHGPTWITNKIEWPIPKSALSTTEMILASDAITLLPTVAGTHGIEMLPLNQLIRDTSNPTHLIRVVAMVKRFINNIRNSIENKKGKMEREKKSGSLTVTEFRRAALDIIRLVQQETYSQVIEDLKQGRPQKSQLIRQLRLYIDDESQLLRSAGRIHNANITNSAKFPILLPPHHCFTRSLIREAHQDVMHLGQQTTVNTIRQRFWVPQLGQAVKSVIHKCVTCRRHHGKPYATPVSPPLPTIRIRDAPSLAVTGLELRSPADQIRRWTHGPRICPPSHLRGHTCPTPGDGHRHVDEYTPISITKIYCT